MDKPEVAKESVYKVDGLSAEAQEALDSITGKIDAIRDGVAEAGTKHEQEIAAANKELDAVKEKQADALSDSAEAFKAVLAETRDVATELTGALQQAARVSIEKNLGESLPSTTAGKSNEAARLQARFEARAMSQPEVARAYADVEHAIMAWAKDFGQGRVSAQVVNELNARAESMYRQAMGISADSGIGPGSAEKGAVTIPRVMRPGVVRMAPELGAMRQVATVIELPRGAGDSLKWSVQTARSSGGWAGTRTKTLADTDTADLGLVEISLNHGYERVPVERFAFSDMPAWAVSFYLSELDERLAALQDEAFVTGSGALEPSGVLNATKYPEKDWTNASRFELGKLSQVKTSDANGFGSASSSHNPGDVFSNAVRAIPRQKRSGAMFVMNPDTLSKVLVMKDSEGRWLGRSSLVEGDFDRVVGRRVLEDDHMPDIAANARPVLAVSPGFYAIVQRSSDSYMVLDIYTDDANHIMKKGVRVGGGILDPERGVAIKVKA